jgi:hypothetical protein
MQTVAPRRSLATPGTETAGVSQRDFQLPETKKTTPWKPFRPVVGLNRLEGYTRLCGSVSIAAESDKRAGTLCSLLDKLH